MSEGTAAPSGATAATAPQESNATKAAPSQTETQKTQATSQQSVEKTQSSSQGASEASTQKEEAITQEEVEELKIGHVSAKVPKSFAKTVKELERAFHAKSQENSSLKKQSDYIARVAKDNPAAFLKQYGIDPDEFSQSQMAEFIKRQMMSPEQRRIEELEHFKQTKDKEDRERYERDLREQQEREIQEESMKLRVECAKAVEKSSVIRDNPFLVQSVIATMARADSQGLGWTWEDCVAKVEEDTWSILKHGASSLSPEQLETKFGSDLLKKWREFDVTRATELASPKLTTPKMGSGETPANPKPKQSGKKVLKESEYLSYFNDLANR
jgi:hypothetical protein